MSDIALDAQIAEVQRELAIRRRVYPKWVARNQLSPAAMIRQIARLEAVLATLEACHDAAEQLSLPGDARVLEGGGSSRAFHAWQLSLFSGDAHA